MLKTGALLPLNSRQTGFLNAPMYLKHFGLNQAPFGITPDTHLFFAGAQRGDVLDALIYAVTHGEGIVKVVGEVGSGKTMLCRMLKARLPDSVDVAYLSNPRIDPADVVYAVAQELRLKFAKTASRLHVQNLLQQALLDRHAKNRRVVVFVEEAQGAPLDTLEEIRLLTNLETEREKLLQIVLFGQPELETNLADPKIRQLRERITHSFTLQPLPENLIADYVRHRLKQAGHRDGDLFSPSALALLARNTGGIMRRINILADKSLLAAFADGASNVNSRHVTAALGDSEFAPPPRPRHHVWPAAIAVTVLVVMMIGALLLSGDPLREPAAPVVAMPAAAPPTPAADDFASQLHRRIETTQSWLDAADDTRLTVQVLRLNADALDELERVLSAPAVRALVEQMFIYRTQRQGHNTFGVLLGDFASTDDAQAALRALPDELKRHRPSIRSVKQVRAMLRDNGTS